MDKIKEILIAGAIGDCFGYKVEFDSIEIIRYNYGKGINLSHLRDDDWDVSDDTQMTLFCLEAIIPFLNLPYAEKYLENITENIYESYLKWFITQTQKFNSEKFKIKKEELLDFKQLYKKQTPGKTCLTSLGSHRMGKIKNPINDSKGCGGIMRVAPISFLNFEMKEIFLLGCLQAAITHGHPTGYLSAGFFAGLIYGGLNNLSFEDSYNKSLLILKNYSNNEEMLSYLINYEKYIQKEFISPEDMVKNLGGGWIGEDALGIAMYCYIKSENNFEKCLEMSTNHSGDSDSTASLACQLFASFNKIPEEILNKEKYLDIKEPLEFLLKQIN